ncbi:hypothetical protein CSUI_003659 [Cystoisospora suis]|uniref:Uncharacterized protein n=1 Tax=Cystoisospora suis TaxID=483139 RepID=A0A2C6KPR9_9APIC|nr:hypothetical protein CSUI_003659 [Cystoisospora suis]
MGNACRLGRQGPTQDLSLNSASIGKGSTVATPECGGRARLIAREGSNRASRSMNKECSFRRVCTISSGSDGQSRSRATSPRRKSASRPSGSPPVSSTTLRPEDEDQLRSFYTRNLREQEKHMSFILTEERKLRRGQTSYSRTPTLGGEPSGTEIVTVDPQEVKEAMERFDVFSPDERQTRVDELLEKFNQARGVQEGGAVPVTAVQGTSPGISS